MDSLQGFFSSEPSSVVNRLKSAFTFTFSMNGLDYILSNMVVTWATSLGSQVASPVLEQLPFNIGGYALTGLHDSMVLGLNKQY